MTTTRSGEQASPQIGRMGLVTDLQNQSFALPDGQCFNIKNDGTDTITLNVQLAGMKEGDFVETKFEIGWNPEIIKVVAQYPDQSINIKWGY